MFDEAVDVDSEDRSAAEAGAPALGSIDLREVLGVLFPYGHHGVPRDVLELLGVTELVEDHRFEASQPLPQELGRDRDRSDAVPPSVLGQRLGGREMFVDDDPALPLAADPKMLAPDERIPAPARTHDRVRVLAIETGVVDLERTVAGIVVVGAPREEEGQQPRDGTRENAVASASVRASSLPAHRGAPSVERSTPTPISSAESAALEVHVWP